MISKEKKYFIFYNDGTPIEKDSISSVKILKDYKFIIKREPLDDYDYRWMVIDENEKEITIRDRNFECVDIRHKTLSSGYNNYFCSIVDLNKKTSHDLELKNTRNGMGIDFVRNELLPTLNILNELGNWECFEIKRKNEELLIEINSLNTVILELKKKLSDLSSL